MSTAQTKQAGVRTSLEKSLAPNCLRWAKAKRSSVWRVAAQHRFHDGYVVGKGEAWEVRVPLVNNPRKMIASIVFEIRMMSSTLSFEACSRRLKRDFDRPCASLA
jgi:hypothetical protein